MRLPEGVRDIDLKLYDLLRGPTKKLNAMRSGQIRPTKEELLKEMKRSVARAVLKSMGIGAGTGAAIGGGVGYRLGRAKTLRELRRMKRNYNLGLAGAAGLGIGLGAGGYALYSRNKKKKAEFDPYDWIDYYWL